MRTVWAEFLVPDDADPSSVSEALELVFQAPQDSAVVHGDQRSAVDGFRIVHADDGTMAAQRRAAAQTVHLSFDYGYPVESEAGWIEAGDCLTQRVMLQPADPEEPSSEAALTVRFEPGTAIVMTAMATGPGVDGPGWRLDPYLVDTEELLQERIASAEAALSTWIGKHYLPMAEGFHTVPEHPSRLRRNAAGPEGPTILEIHFEKGGSTVSGIVDIQPSTLELTEIVQDDADEVASGALDGPSRADATASSVTEGAEPEAGEDELVLDPSQMLEDRRDAD